MNDTGRKEMIDDETGEEIQEEPLSGSGHNNGQSGGSDGGQGDDSGKGMGTNPEEQKKRFVGIAPLKVRTVCLNKNIGEYFIIFVPSSGATDGCLKLYLSAESQDYDANIVKVMGIGQKDIIAEKNVIKNIIFTENTPVRLKVTIDYHDYCSMEVEAYGYKI